VAKAKTPTVAEPIKLSITLNKSLAGRNRTHVATALSMGLRHIGDSKTQPDNPQTRGKLSQIAYLVSVSEEA
jgi:large subunit ribosomal protein L30